MSLSYTNRTTKKYCRYCQEAIEMHKGFWKSSAKLHSLVLRGSWIGDPIRCSVHAFLYHEPR